MTRLAAIGWIRSFSTLERTLLAVVVALVAWNLVRSGGTDWDFLLTKHYFADHYFGGYTHDIVTDQDRTFVTSLESIPSLDHVHAFLSPTDPRYSATYNIDRLYTSGFLPSLIERVSAGAITLRTAIYFSNILTWLLAVLFSGLAATAWFNDRLAGIVAAVLAAGYPVYTVMLGTLKAQSAGAAIFAGWLYVDKAVWPKIGWPERCVLLLATFMATMLASGGAYYIFFYILVRRLYLAVMERTAAADSILTVLAATTTFALAKVATNLLLQHYELQSALAVYDLGRTVRESLQFVVAAVHGEDVSQLRLLNHVGYAMLTVELPRYIAAFVSANPVVVLLPLVAVLTRATNRSLLICVPPLFLAGVGHVVISGWYWYYAYGGAAAGHILIVLAAAALAALLRAERMPVQALGALLLVAGVYSFNADWKFNVENFFDNQSRGPAHLFVYHGPDVVKYW